MTLRPINQLVPVGLQLGEAPASGFPWPATVEQIDREIAATRALISGDGRDILVSRLHGLRICRRIALGTEPPMTGRVRSVSAW